MKYCLSLWFKGLKTGHSVAWEQIYCENIAYKVDFWQTFILMGKILQVGTEVDMERMEQ